MAQDALAFDVIVEPGPQAGPGTGEGLVRQLHHTVVARQQPRRDEALDELLVLRVGGDLAPRHPRALPAHRRRGRDQAQEEVAEDRALLGRRLLVDSSADCATAPRIPPVSR